MFEKNTLKESPWQAKGRWYKAFIESDDTAYKITTIDAGISDSVINSTYLQLPEDFHILDWKYDIHTTGASAASTINGLRLFADGTQGVQLPGKTIFDYMNLYIFGYFDKN